MGARVEADRDSELVREFREGEIKPFEVLLEKYQDRIYRVALKMLRCPEDAEEVCQDTFLTVYRKIDTFQGRSAFYSWLYRIALNCVYMKLRQRKRDEVVSLEHRMPHFDENGRHLQQIPDWSTKADDHLLDHEFRLRLREMVDELPENYKTVFVLHDLEELSNDEVAKIMGLTVAAVKSRLHRARLYLRQRVTEMLEPPGRPAEQ
jgi:RNA polymerase sigma-70 factor (ECF subfamily)